MHPHPGGLASASSAGTGRGPPGEHRRSARRQPPSARLGARFDSLRAQTQRALMALLVARSTRLALDDCSTTVLALDHRLNLAAARLTFGSSTLGAPDADRLRAVGQLLVVHCRHTRAATGAQYVRLRPRPRRERLPLKREGAETVGSVGGTTWMQHDRRREALCRAGRSRAGRVRPRANRWGAVLGQPRLWTGVHSRSSAVTSMQRSCHLPPRTFIAAVATWRVDIEAGSRSGRVFTCLRQNFQRCA
jgi:hypothetical protein